MSTTTPVDLLALIDTYAAAASRRAERVDCAAWAFLDDHRAMIAAREAVAAALGIAAPPLGDDLTCLAAGVEDRERAWQARIDSALGSTR